MIKFSLGQNGKQKNSRNLYGQICIRKFNTSNLKIKTVHFKNNHPDDSGALDLLCLKIGVSQQQKSFIFGQSAEKKVIIEKNK